MGSVGARASRAHLRHLAVAWSERTKVRAHQTERARHRLQIPAYAGTGSVLPAILPHQCKNFEPRAFPVPIACRDSSYWYLCGKKAAYGENHPHPRITYGQALALFRQEGRGFLATARITQSSPRGDFCETPSSLRRKVGTGEKWIDIM